MSVGTRSSSLIGFNGSCLNGGPRQPGRKGSRTQASQQHSASSQVRGQLRGRGHSWEEMAPTGVLWKGERPQGNKEAPLGDPASNRDPIPPSPQEDEQKSPGKGPSRSKTPTPEKTRLPDKVLAPETIPAPDKVSIPKDPVPKKAPDSDKIPATEDTTLDKAGTPESTLSGNKPAKDEALDLKMALHEDTAPALVKILTPEHMIFKKEPSRDNDQCQHLPQGGSTQRPESPAPSNNIQVPGEYSPPPDSSERSCCRVRQVNGSFPAQSKAEDVSAMEEANFLEEPLAKDERTLNKALPKKLPSERAGPQKQVLPQESAPTPQVPHTIQQMPVPEEAPTLHPLTPLTSPKSKNDRMDVLESLKEEVGLLRSRLELLELKLE
jgi:hypothetical protein